MTDETEPSITVGLDGPLHQLADLGEHVARLDLADAFGTAYFQQHLIHQRWLRRGLVEIDKLLDVGYDRDDLVWYLSRAQLPEPIQISGSRLYDVDVIRVPKGTPPSVGIHLQLRCSECRGRFSHKLDCSRRGREDQ